GAVEVGTPVLRRATGLADRLGDSLHALDDLVRDPATDGSVRRLTDVVGSLAPTLRFLNPFQVRCNYLALWTRNASSAVSEGDANGTWFRFIPIVQTPETLQSATPAPALHANVYPHTGQNGECEAGNEPYLPGQQIGNVPGQQAGSTELTGPPQGVGR
ncbi:MAG TPA: MCE family protein, partial [Solirubrobacteraceae bacterium]|nr:MCE family protein [Solirubrobacteraceae bacterium]